MIGMQRMTAKHDISTCGNVKSQKNSYKNSTETLGKVW